jgi:hypothetical protein
MPAAYLAKKLTFARAGPKRLARAREGALGLFRTLRQFASVRRGNVARNWFLAKVRETEWFGGFAIFSRTRAGRRGRAIIEEKPPNAPRPGCHPYGITNFGQEPIYVTKHNTRLSPNNRTTT